MMLPYQVAWGVIMVISLKGFGAVLLAVCVGACATSPREKLGGQVADAVATPFRDLNLIQVEIPPVLRIASTDPYAPPADSSCDALANEIDALDSVLGDDIGANRARPDRPGLLDKGVEAVDKAVVGAVRGAVDVVPYRGWIRKLTGAERDSKNVAHAIFAGRIRRAFLKGIGQHAGCDKVENEGALVRN